METEHSSNLNLSSSPHQTAKVELEGPTLTTSFKSKYLPQSHLYALLAYACGV